MTDYFSALIIVFITGYLSRARHIFIKICAKYRCLVIMSTHGPSGHCSDEVERTVTGWLIILRRIHILLHKHSHMCDDKTHVWWQDRQHLRYRACIWIHSLTDNRNSIDRPTNWAVWYYNLPWRRWPKRVCMCAIRAHLAEILDSS